MELQRSPSSRMKIKEMKHAEQSTGLACQLPRRAWIKASLSACAGSLALGGGVSDATAVDYIEPVAGSKGLTGYYNAGQILIRLNNVVVAAYRAHSTQKYPYFSSLTGPITESSVTTESSLPYPHHRGVWLGCEPMCGGDYWSDRPQSEGCIKSTKLNLGSEEKDSITIHDECDWVGPNSFSPCSDRRRFKFSVPHDGLRLLEINLQLTAHIDIEIAKAKHSFFALRAAPDISPLGGGTLVNSTGAIGAKDTYGKPAKWCCYYGSRRVQPKVVEGIALMDHPQNPWSPCPWLTRDYGHLSPSPFNFLNHPWKLDQGQMIQLQYLIAIHAGNPQEANLDDVYRDWISRTS